MSISFQGNARELFQRVFDGLHCDGVAFRRLRMAFEQYEKLADEHQQHADHRHGDGDFDERERRPRGGALANFSLVLSRDHAARLLIKSMRGTNIPTANQSTMKPKQAR